MIKNSLPLVIITVLLSFLLAPCISAENTGYVGTNGRYFYLNGKNFYMNGANQYNLPFEQQAMVDEILADAGAMGINVIRTWGFADGTGMNGFAFQPQPRVYDEETFKKMDYVIYRANQLNIRLIIPLVNNWDDFGGMNKYVEWSSSANTHDDFYTDALCKAIYKDYVRQFISRINTYTGIAYKDDPTILAWELANEPRCESDRTGNTIFSWVEEMASFIKSIDQNHLVGTGEEGWYVNKGGDWKYNGTKGVDYIRNSNSSYIDYCSFHLYPQNYQMNEYGASYWINEHIDDAHSIVGKPVFLGEFGWKVVREIIGNFSTGTEGWRVDWGFAANSPIRVDSPSQDLNGALVYYPGTSLGSYQFAAGERIFNGSGLDLSQHSFITAWVYIPPSAPSGMRAQIYAKTGTDWLWNESGYYSLIPGQWTRLIFYTYNINYIQQVRSIGIRVQNGPGGYAGAFYFDAIGAFSDLPGATIEDRNRVFNEWYSSFDTRDIDAVAMWILSGHAADTAFSPNSDGYSVYYPEDSSTCSIITGYSDIVLSKNSPITVVLNKARVKQITVTLTRKGKAGIKKQCFASVYVVDKNGKPLTNAAVATHWSGIVGDSDVTVTDSRGIAKNIPSNETSALHGTFTITVDNITKNGYIYDPSLNTETTDSLSY